MGRRTKHRQRQRRELSQRREIRREIAEQGVAVVAGSIRRAGEDWPIHYTVGLTRHEGHPELIVVGECCDCAEAILLGAANAVRRGTRLSPGWGVSIDGWLHVMVDVEQPEHLVLAQDLYRIPDGPLVRALQAIGTDEFGDLPWDSGIGSELMLGPAPG